MWKKSFDDIDNYTYRKGDVIRENDDTNNYLVNDDSRSMCYPISEAFLRQKRRWKFLEWFPQCYHPCSINSLYLRILALPSISHSYSPPSKNGKLIDKSLPKLIISKEFSNIDVTLFGTTNAQEQNQARNHVEKICISASSTKQFPENMLIGSFVYSTFLTKGFPNLKKLFISYCAPFSREDYRQFCLVNRPIERRSLSRNIIFHQHTHTVVFRREGLNDFGFHALTACKNLNLLSISFCEDLTDISLSYVKTLTKLEHLHLRKGKEFTSEGLLELFELSSDDTEFFGRLRFLNLSECPSINDSVVNRITKRCPKLQSLNLAWDWLVTDAGLILITERLMELRFLDVTGMNSITSSAFLYVPDLYLPDLRFLCIVQCPSERCDSRYAYAVTDLLQQYQGFCCMSTLR
ncbi:hypothetical protein DINM_002229 [Dirofilaria immitis]|nr:hypothetical protein [Dirofilaria immitis]